VKNRALVATNAFFACGLARDNQPGVLPHHQHQCPLYSKTSGQRFQAADKYNTFLFITGFHGGESCVLFIAGLPIWGRM
jgi:hypothetical protein